VIARSEAIEKEFPLFLQKLLLAEAYGRRFDPLRVVDYRVTFELDLETMQILARSVTARGARFVREHC
jgi:hypothetical protein